MAGCLAHMRSAHSFFIPDFEFLTDLDGLLEHLLLRVVDGRCLHCRARFASASAAQAHMAALAHCRYAYDKEEHFEEYCEFYDYAGASSSDEEEEGEEEEGAERGATVGGGGGGGRDLRVGELGDLLLPRGGRAAPRHLMRYYRQRLGQVGGVSEGTRAQLERLALDYAAAGPSSSRALRALELGRSRGAGTRGNRVDARAQKLEDRYRHGHLLQIGIDMNQIRRRYFKVQILV